MPALDEQIETFARRHSYSPTKARQEAERLIENAVAAALAGAGVPFDHLHELESEARLRYRDRLAAGEGDASVERRSGTTGARL